MRTFHGSHYPGREPSSGSLYHYKAKLVRVIDGDSIVVDIDLGLGIWARLHHIRLYGINAPELRGPEKAEGRVSLQMLIDLLGIGTDHLLIQTIKDKEGKFGRLLGIVWARSSSGAWFNVNKCMVVNGYAVARKY